MSTEPNREKIIDKVAKLKAKLDHVATGGQMGSTAEELETVALMMQRLMAKHKIDMTEIELSQMEVEEPVGYHPIDYAKYPDLKVRQKRVAWMERLASIIARAHFCRIAVDDGSNVRAVRKKFSIKLGRATGSSKVTLIGRKSDCEIAEYMIVTIQRMAEKIAHKEYCAYYWHHNKLCFACDRREEEHAGLGHKFDSAERRARGFKESFLQAFVMRLSERYEEARRATEGESSMALVRVNRAEQAVNDFLKNAGTAKALATRDSHHADGYSKGVDAANKVGLKSNALTPREAWKTLSWSEQDTELDKAHEEALTMDTELNRSRKRIK